MTQAKKVAEVREDRATFESMQFDELLSLREKLDDLIAQRIGAEERALEERLNRIRQLKQVDGGVQLKRPRSSNAAARKLPIRYRNPDNPAQAWAGRGLQPRWLKQALKAGKKLDHFMVVRVD